MRVDAHTVDDVAPLGRGKVLKHRVNEDSGYGCFRNIWHALPHQFAPTGYTIGPS